MGNPNPNLQGTIVSLYDIGWYVASIASESFSLLFQLLWSDIDF